MVTGTPAECLPLKLMVANNVDAALENALPGHSWGLETWVGPGGHC